MENKKVTKKENFGAIKDILIEMGRTDLAEVMAHEIELLSRKSTKATQTKTQKENKGVAEMLINELAKVGTPTTITDLMNNSEVIKAYRLENGNPLSNQKISAIFKILKDENKIIKVTDKKKSYFSIAD